MARLVRGRPTARSQQEGIEEPERDPQQEDQPDATGGKDIADCNPDVGYEGSEPKLSRVLKNKGRLILMQNLWKWNFPKSDPPPEDDSTGTVQGVPVGT